MNQLLAQLRVNPVGKVILSVTSFLLGTNTITSVLGFFYWLVAARIFSPTQVGFGSATISAMQLLGSVSLLGIGTTLIREIPRKNEGVGVLVVTGLVTVAITGVVLGAGGALLLPLISRNLGAITSTLPGFLLFVVGVSLSAVSLLVDQILIGLLRGFMQFMRNAIFATAKLLALAGLGFALMRVTGLSILVSWIGGIVVSLVIVLFTSTVMGHIRVIYRPRLFLVRDMARTALGHHLLNMELIAPNLAMPVVVSAVLSTASTAYFASALNIANFILYIPYALAVTLFAVGASGTAADIGSKARFTIGVAVIAGVLANLFLFVAAGPILSIFGAVYQDQATWCLRLLGLGVFPLIIKDQYIAICRVRGKVGNVARGMVVGTIIELGGAAIGGKVAGLLGLAIGWEIALVLEALAMLPPLLRVIRPHAPAVQVNTSLVAVVASASLPGVLIGELETLTMPAINRAALEAHSAHEVSLMETIPQMQAISQAIHDRKTIIMKTLKESTTPHGN